VTLSRKGAKSGTQVRKLRSTGTKVRTRVGHIREPRAELERKLAEALAQQTATSKVLQIIARSPGDLAPVLQTILENAVRILEAKFGTLFRCEGDMVRAVAGVGLPPKLREFQAQRGLFRPLRDLQHALHLKRPIQRADAATEMPEAPSVKFGGARTHIVVPLLKADEVIGAIIIYRQEVRPFTDKQIALVQTFANQAVVAIENTRLLNELRESLQQQTATADVLKVISRSTFDLQTVLDTLVESAARLCRADRTVIRIARGGLYQHVSDYGFVPEVTKRMMREPVEPTDGGSMVGRVLRKGKAVHLIDAQADLDEDMARRARTTGTRSLLGVPLMREGSPIGVLLLQRSVIQPFTGKQIELATTFADQAVIAIENVRLFDEVQARTRELSEALEQQTATSEVLQVISSSPGNLDPVFQAMLGNATSICEAKFGTLWLREGDAFRPVALHNAPPAYAEARRRELCLRPPPDTALGRAASTKQVVHIEDITTHRSYDPDWLAAIELGNYRTVVCVPMLKDDELIGAISIFRQEVRQFTDKQVDLLQNFARQAVIAIENTRLLNELRQRTDDLSEALEQQTATSEVLRVISSSPGELEPVFQAMLANATRICEAKFATLYLCEGDGFRAVAMHNAPPAFAEARARAGIIHPHPDTTLARAASTKGTA
jgi:GAF domain-containing protein